jgi:hypothetical protein
VTAKFRVAIGGQKFCRVLCEVACNAVHLKQYMLFFVTQNDLWWKARHICLYHFRMKANLRKTYSQPIRYPAVNLKELGVEQGGCQPAHDTPNRNGD